MPSTTPTQTPLLPAKAFSPLVRAVILACWIAPAALLNGCATQAAQHAHTAAPAEVAPAKPELSADFIYKYLAAELAGQRGDLITSSAIFYELAKTSHDPRLAERAAKVAAHINAAGIAVPAIKLWAELDPESNEAQQAATELLIAAGKLNEVEPFLAKLLAKEESRASGFLFLNSLLNRSPDKVAVLHLIQSLAKPYPDLAEAQLAIAQAAWIAKQDHIALEALNQTETLYPSWHAAALLKGQVLYRQSPQAAIDFYRDFLNQAPEANEVRINLAKLLVNQKQYDAAKAEFPTIIQAAQNESNVADIHTIVGLMSYQAADYKAADGYFQKALMLGFKDIDQLSLYLGQTAEKMQQDNRAIDWYKRVPQGARYLEAQINIANLIARSQSTDKAIALLDNLEDLNTEQQIIVIQTQASLLNRAKRYEEAFTLLDSTVKNMPNTPDLVYDYALAAERMQKFDLMESELRKAIAQKPDFAAAYNALGYSFADRNVKIGEAIKLIEKALSLAPEDHYMLDSLGWAYYRKGNLGKAIQYLQQAYDINPDPEIAAHLGEVLWKKGEFEQAKKIWSDALQLNPDNEVLVSTANKFKS